MSTHPSARIENEALKRKRRRTEYSTSWNTLNRSSSSSSSCLRGQRSTPNWLVLVVLLVVCLSSTVQKTLANDEDDYEFVNAILDEASESYDEDSYGYEDPPSPQQHDEDEEEESYEERLLRQQQEAKEEKERLIQEEIRREREEAFAQELLQASSDLEKLKALKKQKRKDARIVQGILKAAQHDNHYAVIGLHNWEYQTSSYTVKAGPYEWTLPQWSLFRIGEKEIKKAFRAQARSVHPDKNRDGRANEAFIAVEHAASILSDEALRTVYDADRRAFLRHRRANAKKLVVDTVERGVQVTGRTIGLIRSVLGPFALPVFVISALLV